MQQIEKAFRRSENSLFDVLIALIILFDVVMVSMVFGVLFLYKTLVFSYLKRVGGWGGGRDIEIDMLG